MCSRSSRRPPPARRPHAARLTQCRRRLTRLAGCTPLGPVYCAGGPFPVIGGPGHASLTAFLKAWPATLASKPKALLVVSGHHEEPVATVTSAPRPELIYDYHGACLPWPCSRRLPPLHSCHLLLHRTCRCMAAAANLDHPAPAPLAALPRRLPARELQPAVYRPRQPPAGGARGGGAAGGGHRVPAGRQAGVGPRNLHPAHGAPGGAAGAEQGGSVCRAALGTARRPAALTAS